MRIETDRLVLVHPCRNEDRGNSFELWGIYIEPLMQDRGIGKQLMGYCEEIARERGYSEDVLWVLRENGKSRRFYEKHGYVPDGSEIYMEKIDAVEIRYVKPLLLSPI